MNYCTEKKNITAFLIFNPHLNKLESLLSIQPVGQTEGVQRVWLVQLAQQFGEAGVDVLFALLMLQRLHRTEYVCGEGRGGGETQRKTTV